jgi:hypothetical protein
MLVQVSLHQLHLLLILLVYDKIVNRWLIKIGQMVRKL